MRPVFKAIGVSESESKMSSNLDDGSNQLEICKRIPSRTTLCACQYTSTQRDQSQALRQSSIASLQACVLAIIATRMHLYLGHNA